MDTEKLEGLIHGRSHWDPYLDNLDDMFCLINDLLDEGKLDQDEYDKVTTVLEKIRGIVNLKIVEMDKKYKEIVDFYINHKEK